jgi:hypothetical protein
MGFRGQHLVVQGAYRVASRSLLARRERDHGVGLVEACQTFRVPGVPEFDEESSQILGLQSSFAFVCHLELLLVRSRRVSAA